MEATAQQLVTLIFRTQVKRGCEETIRGRASSRVSFGVISDKEFVFENGGSVDLDRPRDWNRPGAGAGLHHCDGGRKCDRRLFRRWGAGYPSPTRESLQDRHGQSRQLIYRGSRQRAHPRGFRRQHQHRGRQRDKRLLGRRDAAHAGQHLEPVRRGGRLLGATSIFRRPTPEIRRCAKRPPAATPAP